MTNTPQNNYRLYTCLVCTLMIVLAFISLIVAYANPVGNNYTWYFWTALCPCFLFLNLSYCYYLKHTNQLNTTTVHYNYYLWSIILTAWLVIHLAMFEGMMQHSAGGLVTLLLLSIAVFIQGITLHKIFFLVGSILFLLVLCLIMLSNHLAWVTFAITVIGLATIYTIVCRH